MPPTLHQGAAVEGEWGVAGAGQGEVVAVRYTLRADLPFCPSHLVRPPNKDDSANQSPVLLYVLLALRESYFSFGLSIDRPTGVNSNSTS